MKKTFKLLILLMLFTLVGVPTSSAQAQGPDPDSGGQVIFGSNYTVESGDTFDGDLVLLGGNVTIEEDASLNGDLVVIGGTIQSNGEITGSVVVVGGQLKLEESALVAGDVVTIGGQLERAEGAKVEGEIVNNVAPNFTIPNGRIPPTVPDVPVVPVVPEVPVIPEVVRPNVSVGWNFAGQVMGIFGWAVGLGAFSMLLALFLLPQMERTGRAIVSQPLMTGGIGLLSMVVALVLILTVVPAIFVIFAWFFGVVAMGLEVGNRFTKAINQVWTPVFTVGFGTFLLVLTGGIIGLIPCLGGLIVFLFGLVAVGGAVITLFGTRPIQAPVLAIYTPPTGPAPGEDAPVG